MSEAEVAPTVIEPGVERAGSWIGGGFGVVFKLLGQETGGQLAIVEHPVWPRVLVTPHVHQNEDEYSYVLEGTIGARVGDREVEAATGGYLVKPRGIPHAFWNPTDKPARLMEMISPAGFERFFAELGVMVAEFDRNPGDLAPEERGERLAALASRYRLTYLPDWIPELQAKYGLRVPSARIVR